MRTTKCQRQINPPAPIRILIVDDHLVVRAGLHMLIENHPGMTVVAMASNRTEAWSCRQRFTQSDSSGSGSARRKRPTFLTQLRETTPKRSDPRLTGLRDTDAHRQAVQLGAMGVVLKEHAPDVLIKAIEKVHAGEIWLDRPTMGRMLREMSAREEKEIDPGSGQDRISHATRTRSRRANRRGTQEPTDRPATVHQRDDRHPPP